MITWKSPSTPRSLSQESKRCCAATSQHAAVPAKPAVECVEYPDLTINKTNYSVMYMGKMSICRQRSWSFSIFGSFANHVFPVEQLLDQIWGYEYIGDTRTVDVHIKRLREKIKDHANWKIATIWGIGYKFEVR